MEKIDLKKEISSYKSKHNKFEIITVPKLNYLMIDGQGDPNTSSEYAKTVELLYSFAYKLKFLSKRELGKDYVVGPLEGLWWSSDMNDFNTRNKSNWEWTMMVVTPDWITKEHFAKIKNLLIENHLIEEIRLQELDEGLSVQTLHIGSYDDETPVLEKLHKEFLPANNLKPTFKHHEIYLSDPRRVSADKLKTILRQPVSKA